MFAYDDHRFVPQSSAFQGGLMRLFARWWPYSWAKDQRIAKAPALTVTRINATKVVEVDRALDHFNVPEPEQQKSWPPSSQGRMRWSIRPSQQSSREGQRCHNPPSLLS